MSITNYVLHPIGSIDSTLTDRAEAPRQGNEGAPDAWIRINETVVEGLEGIEVGSELIVITWFHESSREILKVHPRNEITNPLTGVFATRSPDRPNPLGLHRVKVIEIERNRLKVGPIEAINGTPVVDIKPVLQQTEDS
jgi:tRNA-Thr(GGU) m(6)t(6)A37 methyltransferase TsaA